MKQQGGGMGSSRHTHLFDDPKGTGYTALVSVNSTMAKSASVPAGCTGAAFTAVGWRRENGKTGKRGQIMHRESPGRRASLRVATKGHASAKAVFFADNKASTPSLSPCLSRPGRVFAFGSTK